MMNKIIIGLCLISALLSCSQKKLSERPKKTIDQLCGTYVSSDYTQRSKGYDWSAIIIDKTSDSTASIAIRSRADQMQEPSCRYDAPIGRWLGNDTIQTSFDQTKIFFTVTSDTLSVSSTDDNQLHYFCRGGGTIEGDYKKLTEPLDTATIDKRDFSQVLSWNQYSFLIEAEHHKLSITPAGLSKDNRPQIHDLTGYTITGAEIGDLNHDNYPEICIYLTSDGSGSYGKLIAYSVNNGKSMSQIYLPEIADNPKVNKGYRGHDQMAIVESSFCQRFPIYHDSDTNASPSSGKIRQIQYKLVNGEAGRIFKIKSVTEYSTESQR